MTIEKNKRYRLSDIQEILYAKGVRITNQDIRKYIHAGLLEASKTSEKGRYIVKGNRAYNFIIQKLDE